MDNKDVQDVTISTSVRGMEYMVVTRHANWKGFAQWLMSRNETAMQKRGYNLWDNDVVNRGEFEIWPRFMSATDVAAFFCWLGEVEYGNG